ncbi:MAG: SusC/RagA family TonB-linked outer membrane protein, partial [Flavobacteriaceae bacterium]
ATGGELPGVGIIIKGTTKGTATDFDGNYSLENVKQGDVLVFSYIGFTTLEVTVGANATINVALDQDAETLDEIVVIGYGTTTIKDATGAVAAISEKDFNEGNIVSAANLITGRVAGVNITSDGAPGGGSSIRIRGGSSLGASNDPLIVIDGMPISNSNAEGSRGILASINPNDIESFSILKDASSTAIYGSRASNGVIIITTKKGKSIFRAEYNVKAGLSTLANKVDVFTADKYRALIADIRPNDIDKLGNANTDWQDKIYQEKVSIDHSLSLSGQLFNKMPARFSFGYTDQPGLRKTSSFERISSKLSLNPTFLDDHLKVNINASLNSEANRFADDVTSAALEFDPTQPVYDANSPFGGFFEYHTDGDRNNAPRNPLASLLQRENKSQVQRFYGNINLDYKLHFLPDLRAVVNIGYDITKSKGYNILSTESINGYSSTDNAPYLGASSEYTGERKNTLLDAYLNYTKELENVNIEVTAGYSYQKFKGNNYNTYDLINPNDAAADLNTHPDIVLIGFFGRTNLSFMDKYLLTLSYRRDGTSRFSKDNRWGNFPAAAIAWKISEENFLKDSNTISNLKLRLGWGITGQQDIPPSYLFLGRTTLGSSVSQYIFSNSPISVAIPQTRIEDLKWEETTTYNIGIDYGLFKGKVSGSFDAYLKESKDLLADVAISDGSNFSNSGFQNIGKFTSKGIEFSIGTDIINTDDLTIDANYNISFNQTKIDKLALNQDFRVGGIGGGTGGTIQLHSQGFAPFSYYVYKQLYDVNGTPINGAYADLNQDGIINDTDRYLYKKPDADILMGFQSNINYKDFDLTFSLRASIGNYAYNNVNSAHAQYSNLQRVTALGNIPVSVLETGFTTTSEVITSDIYIENASFLKMDNITLGYTFRGFNNHDESSSIRLWAGVENVFTITNYSGIDPEIFGGIDNTIYPRPRTFLLGANFKF